MSDCDVTTIHDFVNRRWLDAKCALRQLDSQFVDKMEATARLGAIGLHTSWDPDLEEKPKKRLSKQWHRLLEACMDLTFQVSKVQVATDSLRADAYPGMLPIDVGKRVSYHYYSLIIHMNTLSSHVNEVSRQTIEMYLDNREKAKKLTRQYKDKINSKMRDLNDQRNALVHVRRSYTKVITDGGWWEGNVAMNFTPQMFLDQDYAPGEYERLRSGAYAWLDAAVAGMCAFFGSILGELEKDIRKE